MDRFHQITPRIAFGKTICLWAAGLFFLSLLASDAGARDWVALKDGTILECEVAKEEDLEVYLKFKNGTIRVGREHIRLLARETPEEFVPENDEEEAMFEKGKVRFEGEWLSIRKRDQIVSKRYAEIKKKIEEIEKHQNWYHAYEIDDKNFIYKSNAPKDTLDFYIERWQAFYKYFSKDWKIKIKGGHKRKKPLICIYKDEADYRKFSDASENAKGFFRPSTEELHIYHDRTDIEDTLETLFHEGTHLLVHYLDPRPGYYYPIWLNEGLAEYMSACEYDGKIFTPGSLQGDRLVYLDWAMEKGQLMTMDEMLFLPQANFTYEGGYPAAWSFVHFMMEHKKYPNKFKEFAIGLTKDKATRTKDTKGWMRVSEEDLNKYFKKLFKGNMKDFDEEWHAHIHDLLANRDAKSNFYHGEQLLAKGQFKESRDALNMAIDGGVELPRCYYLLSVASYQLGAGQSALNAIEKALELDPLNSRYYYWLGVVNTNAIKGGRDQGKAYLDLCLELDPGNISLKKRVDHFWGGGSATEEIDDDD